MITGSFCCEVEVRPKRSRILKKCPLVDDEIKAGGKGKQLLLQISLISSSLEETLMQVKNIQDQVCGSCCIKLLLFLDR